MRGWCQITFSAGFWSELDQRRLCPLWVVLGRSLRLLKTNPAMVAEQLHMMKILRTALTMITVATAPTCASALDFNVSPLKQRSMNAGDIEVRVIYIGSLGVSSAMLQLERSAATSKATYFFDGDSAAKPHRSVQLLPKATWPYFWRKFDNLEVNIIRSQNEMTYEMVPLDSERVTIQVKHGSAYREVSWSAPTLRENPEAKNFAKAIKFVQDSFAIEFPEPYSEKGTTADGKQLK